MLDFYLFMFIVFHFEKKRKKAIIVAGVFLFFCAIRTSARWEALTVRPASKRCFRLHAARAYTELRSEEQQEAEDVRPNDGKDSQTS